MSSLLNTLEAVSTVEVTDAVGRVQGTLEAPSIGDVTEAVSRLLGILEAASTVGYIGEPVSQLDHALQCAAAAERSGAEDEVVLAALFHDLGHLVRDDAGRLPPQMEGLGTLRHEALGAEALLRAGCSGRVAELVRQHVPAKRYLCFAKPAYLGQLSAASRGTLAHQGGPMSADEAKRFVAHPDFSTLLALRSWDERAKVPHALVPGLSSHRARLQAHLENDR